MKAHSIANQNQSHEDSTLESEYKKKFSKKKNNKKGKSSKEKNMFFKTILEQLQLQNSSLSDLIYKWYIFYNN